MLRKLLVFTSVMEILVGLSLIIIPSVIVEMLFGINLSESVYILGRLSGIILLCFGIACLPFKENSEYNNYTPSVRAMMSYNFLASVYFFFLIFSTKTVGILLIPAAILHAAISIYFAFLLFGKKGN